MNIDSQRLTIVKFKTDLLCFVPVVQRSDGPVLGLHVSSSAHFHFIGDPKGLKAIVSVETLN